jgi:hypothetical protein
MKPICILKAGRRLLDKDPVRYAMHAETVLRIRARFMLVNERNKGRVA